MGEMPNPASGRSAKQPPEYHLPVLTAEVVNGLIAAENGVFLDGTLGEGGHSLALLRAAPQARLVIGVDLDSRSVATAAARLLPFGTRFLGLDGNYTEMVSLAARQGMPAVDGVLLDLGFSSRQVDRPGYGLSFQSDEPLDMRYDAEQSLDAATVVNERSESELTGILRRFGEEPRARAIARAIVKERGNGPLATTTQLASLVERVAGRRSGRRVHPATRVFQALRIAVNGELDNLQAGLDAAVELLNPGGRVAVISYHSLEDRIVKNYLARLSAVCICPPGLPECVCEHSPALEVINRRVIRPSVEEVASNPRSRSARMRLARKI
jgi:16S rRNA (cytosine1402-N4)-methyltransferase